jgi:hypothetical protein
VNGDGDGDGKPNGDGKPTFRLWQLLDSWRIKPWFSQAKQDFNKKVTKQLSAQTSNANTDMDLQIDMDDVIDDE